MQNPDALEIIYLRELKTLIPLKDTRSIKAFLLSHNVEVFGGKGSKQQYVFKIQFERAILEQKIRDLKQKYGHNWTTAFQAEMRVLATHKAAIGNLPKTSSIPVKKHNDSFGPLGAQFLKDLHNP